MSSSVSIQYLGYLGAAIGVGRVVPQLARTYRNRALGGVSVLSWVLNGLSCFTWLLYGIRAEELPQIPGNVFIVSGAFAIALAVPSSISPGRRAVGIAVPAVFLVAVATVLPPSAVGFVAFGLGLVSALPQVYRSMRRGVGEVSAVSVPGWILFAISQACWLIYALVVHDVVVIIAASWSLLSSVVISACELRQRTTGEGGAPADLDLDAPAVAVGAVPIS